MRFPLRNELGVGFEGLMNAAGRALGLAMRCGAELSFLNLAPSLLTLLHPRFRFNTPQDRLAILTQELGLPISEAFAVVESAYLVSVGMEAALGPGGFELYNELEWEVVLGHSPMFETLS